MSYQDIPSNLSGAQLLREINSRLLALHKELDLLSNHVAALTERVVSLEDARVRIEEELKR